MSDEMEEKISKWIIEYLLRKRIDDKVINGVVASLPLSNNDYRLKKTILLRRIETETSNGCVSEKILEFIELIEALDHEKGKTASDSLKEAYCAVAVDCTVRFLGESVEENVKYMEMVEIVWRNRVCKSEGLNSEALKRWSDDIEEAGKDEKVCEKIWRRNTRNEALKAVKKYLKEAWEYLGPPFLEVVATREANRVEGSGGGDVVGSGNPVREFVAVEVFSFTGSQKGPGVVRRKHVAVKSKRPRGAIISDAADDVTEKAADSTTEMIRAGNPIREENRTPEVDREKEARSSSSTKLPVVGDRLSDNFPTPQTLSPTGPTGNDNAVEADKMRTELPENGEPVRRKEVLGNGRRELHAAVNYPLPEGDKSNNAVEADKTRADIPDSRETVRTHRTHRNGIRELHAAANVPLPVGDKSTNNAVEADKTGTDIPHSRGTVRTQRTRRISTREFHAAANVPLSEGDKNTNNVVEADKRRTDIPDSRETVRTPRTHRNSTRELHATASDPLPEGDKSSNNAVEANNARTEIPDSCETLRMQRGLRNSTRELYAAVNDPLPDALQTAQAILSSMVTNNHVTVAKNQTSQDMPAIPEAEETPELAKNTLSNTGSDAGVSKQAGTETNATKGSNENDPRNLKHNTLKDHPRNVTQDPGVHKNTRKRSLMEPNGTSHTYEWDDDIENSSGSPTRPRLPSPKVQRTSPLKIADHRNLQRRIRKRWTPVEEEALREGVLKHGRGNWKVILAHYAEVFQSRTDVDLKDKWRNMTKYS